MKITKIMPYFKGNRLFLGFIFTYMIIFVITLLSASLFYSYTLKIVEKYTIDSALSILEHSRDMVNSHLREIDNITDQMAADYNIQGFLNVCKPLQDIDYENLRNIRSRITYNYMNNTFIKDIYVYFPNSDVLISTSVASARIETLYGYYLNYEGISYEKWREKVLSGKYYSTYWSPRIVHTVDYDISAVTYLKSIQNWYSLNPGGFIIAMINEKDILDILDNTLIRNGGWSYIKDSQGNYITSINYSSIEKKNVPDGQLQGTGSYEIMTDAGKMLIMHTVSDNNWKYVAAIPADVLMNKVSNITKIFIIITMIAFILDIVIAAYMSGKNSRPIQDMVRVLNAVIGKESSHVKNEYDFIKGTITNLINMNRQLKEDMKKQEMLLQANFCERLLRNRFANQDELKNHMEYAKIQFHEENYIVVLVKINGYYGQITREMLCELGEVGVLIMSILNKRLCNLGYLHQLDEYNIAAILGVALADPRESNNYIKSIIMDANEELLKYNIKTSFGIGRLCADLSKIWECFNEAEKAFEHIEGKENVIYIFDEMLINSTEYYFPIELETRLLNLVKMGEKKGVLDILNTIHMHNFVKRRLSGDKTAQLFSEICGTVIKLKDELLVNDMEYTEKINRTIKAFNGCKQSESAYWDAVGIFADLCEYVLNRKESHNIRLREEILEYINNDYMNRDLCLYCVASKFHLAEKYFSRFFKDQTGENFSNYLEKTRMEKAKKLLCESEYSIQEVAGQVGYQNINTFYKAFKRIYGVSPRSYKYQN